MRVIRRARRAVRRRLGRGGPRVGHVDLGDLRRTTPISDRWGFDRGRPVDRFYIERFLERHREDVTGRVLEVANDLYTRRFGHDLTRVDVLHAVDGNPAATIVADLTDAPGIADGSFECVILTQTLQFIDDAAGAVATVGRILAPGGVVLATVPGISKVSQHDAERWGDHWRFTAQSARGIFERTFAPADVEVESAGNVLAATAFLYGLGAEELREAELLAEDPWFPVTIAIRATRATGPGVGG